MPESLSNDIGGEWSEVFDWPLIGIQATMTPDGKILTFGTNQSGQQGATLIYDVWDPATNIHYTLPNKTKTDVFCAAAVVVPSTGEVLITGGDARPLGHTNKGVHDVNTFDYRDMSLKESPDGPMRYDRWYPTAVELANGKVLVLGGQDMNGNGVGTPELYTPGEGWKPLTGAYSQAIADDPDYPRAWLASNGNVVMIDSGSTTSDRADVVILDPSGKGTLTKVADLPFTTSWKMPAIKYAADKVLMLDDKGDAWVMDMSGSKPTFQKTGSLGETRYWSNMVVLADGSVMVSGGSDSDNKLVGVDYAVQIWNPQTGVWTTGDAAALPRMYHSTTILLPDATVLSLGGGAPGPLTNMNGEIYKPGYLFNADGSLATRPVITDAPDSIEQRQNFTIEVDDAASITRLTLVKTGSVTHSMDMSTGMFDLSFTRGESNALNVTVPTNSNAFAPGSWMLFAFNDQGTPSVAAMVTVGLGGEIFSAGFDGYVTESGAASYDAASDTFTLTANATSKVGAVMSNDRIDLTQDFTVEFSAYLGNKDSGGSGIAFVLHNDPSGGDAFGGASNAQGANGIANGLAISLDTYRESSSEMKSDHTDFFDTDATAGTSLTKATALPQLEDGRWHDVKVSWHADTQTLTYWVDGKAAGTMTGDLANQYFSGSDYVHFGFTGATGSSRSNLQQVKVTGVDAAYAPADAHADSIAQIGSTAQMSGSAGFDAEKQAFTLTPAGASMKGAVMSDAHIDLNSDFQVSFNFFLGSNDGGSQGATFILHSDPNGEDAIGNGGSGLGAQGIKNGLAIAFNATRGSETTRLVDTDSGSSLKALTSSVSLGNLENGRWHQADVTWDAETQTLKYWVDGKLGGTLTGDLAAKYFGGSDHVHFGFTGATGSTGNVEQVRVTKLSANAGDLEYGAFGACHCDPFMETDEHSDVTRVGSATINAANLVTLTPSVQSTSGSAFSLAKIDLDGDFSLAFDFYAGSKDVSGGGLSFVLHNDTLGADVLGGAGTALGAGGIRNGLGVAFSTAQGADSTRFFDTDLGTSAGGLSPQTAFGNLQNGAWHSAQVTWDASDQTLSYWVDGRLGGTLTGDLAQQYFAGSDHVYFGFTGTTGKTANLQQVQVRALDGNLLCADCGTEGPGNSHDAAGHHDNAEEAHIDGITITAGSTDDNVTGTAGDDAIIGGRGADTLTGGEGHDRFVYRFATEGGDKILDFSIMEDSFSFSASGFGAGLTAGLSLVAGINFIANENPTATTTAGTFLFNIETHELSWDFDGSANGAAVLIADLHPQHSLMIDHQDTLTISHFEITA